MEPTLTPTPTPSRTYFRPTTASQRQLLFSAVATGGTVSAAARQAHVGRGTYYYWSARYADGGPAGLLGERSRAPQHPRLAPISAAIWAEVLAYAEAHPHERGGRTIAARLRQAHQGQPVIGHSKVAEILRLARATPGAAGPAPTPPVTPAPVAVVHAPAPNQTANIDLCVVPVTHDGEQAWASVSVSEAAAGATGRPHVARAGLCRHHAPVSRADADLRGAADGETHGQRPT